MQLDKRKKKSIYIKEHLLHNEVLADLLRVMLKRPTLRHWILEASGLFRWKEHFLAAARANEYPVIRPNLGYVKRSGCKPHMCLLKAMPGLRSCRLAWLPAFFSLPRTCASKALLKKKYFTSQGVTLWVLYNDLRCLLLQAIMALIQL